MLNFPEKLSLVTGNLEQMHSIPNQHMKHAAGNLKHCCLKPGTKYPLRNACLSVLLLVLLLSGCRYAPNKEKIVYISGKSVKVGIIPSLGGSVVYLAKGNSGNLLLSDTAYWNLPDSLHPSDSPGASYLPVNGHTVWVGPQAGWWLQQDVDTVLRKAKAEWPPDPFLTTARYSVNERSDELIGMLGPESPYTGIQMEKQVRVEPMGLVSLQVLAKNIRSKVISWDIWFNTRFPSSSRVYVPVPDTAHIQVIESNDSLATGFNYRVTDGFFTFIPDSVPAGMAKRYAKAYIYPQRPYIALFEGKYLLVIRFPKYPVETIHPAQNLVEIELCRSLKATEEQLSLQHHAPYKNLNPGELMSAWETWEIIDYDGGSSLDDHTAFLRKIGL